MLWYVVMPPNRAVQVVTAWVFVTAVHAGLAWTARSLARTCGPGTTARRFWFAVATGGVIYLIGDLAQIWYSARHPGAEDAATGGSVQATLLSVGSLWLGAALLTSPLGLSSHRERVRFWLDVATVTVAGVVAGWFLIAPDQPGALLHAALPVLLGPVILIFCIFIVAKLVMSGTSLFTRACAIIGTVAAAVKSSADALSSHGPFPLAWFLALTVASHALLTIAVRVTQTQVRANPGALVQRVRRKPYSILPYAAIAVTYGLLTWAIMRHASATVPIALAGAAVSTLLVVLRQLDAFNENARLLTERDQLASQLRYEATHDALTGLANRTLFAQHLDATLTEGTPAAVLLVDLDDFKQVNDAHGHAAGDTVLRAVADRMRTCVRDEDVICRTGGDEFAILLVSPDDAQQVANRMAAQIEAPIEVDGGTARVGASIGIAPTMPGADSELLLRQADHAMYAVKRAGKATYAIATESTA